MGGSTKNITYAWLLEPKRQTLANATKITIVDKSIGPVVPPHARSPTHSDSGATSHYLKLTHEQFLTDVTNISNDPSFSLPNNVQLAITKRGTIYYTSISTTFEKSTNSKYSPFTHKFITLIYWSIMWYNCWGMFKHQKHIFDTPCRNFIFDNSGNKLNIDKLLDNPTKHKIWSWWLDDELGRLTQGFGNQI